MSQFCPRNKFGEGQASGWSVRRAHRRKCIAHFLQRVGLSIMSLFPPAISHSTSVASPALPRTAFGYRNSYRYRYCAGSHVIEVHVVSQEWTGSVSSTGTGTGTGNAQAPSESSCKFRKGGVPIGVTWETYRQEPQHCS